MVDSVLLYVQGSSSDSLFHAWAIRASKKHNRHTMVGISKLDFANMPSNLAEQE